MTAHTSSALPRLLAGLGADQAPLSRASHLALHGPLPGEDPAAILAEVERSGLRGRGGADFPTAVKLRSVIGRRRRPVLVVNGSETEPASAKDHLLLDRLPHLVLDGAELAARATGAERIVVKLRASVVREHTAIAAALAERPAGAVPVELVLGTDGYVAGEETAVVRFLDGGPALPTFTPPRPYERGVGGRPTLVQNVETLAQLALITRHGADWYRELGTSADPGTALITLAGAVRSPGVYEFAFGTPMTELLDAAGGPSEPLRAVLVGGYFGTWIEAGEALALRLSRAELRASGAALGSGVLLSLGASACGVHETARLAAWLSAQSAGQCGPCVHGLGALAAALGALADGGDGDGGTGAGRADESPLDQLHRWGAEIRGRGACQHPDGAVRLVESGLTVFAREFAEHAARRPLHCDAAPAGLPLPRASVRQHSR